MAAMYHPSTIFASLEVATLPSATAETIESIADGYKTVMVVRFRNCNLENKALLLLDRDCLRYDHFKGLEELWEPLTQPFSSTPPPMNYTESPGPRRESIGLAKDVSSPPLLPPTSSEEYWSRSALEVLLEQHEQLMAETVAPLQQISPPRPSQTLPSTVVPQTPSQTPSQSSPQHAPPQSQSRIMSSFADLEQQTSTAEDEARQPKRPVQQENPTDQPNKRVYPPGWLDCSTSSIFPTPPPPPAPQSQPKQIDSSPTSKFAFLARLQHKPRTLHSDSDAGADKHEGANEVYTSDGDDQVEAEGEEQIQPPLTTKSSSPESQNSYPRKRSGVEIQPRPKRSKLTPPINQKQRLGLQP